MAKSSSSQPKKQSFSSSKSSSAPGLRHRWKSLIYGSAILLLLVALVMVTVNVLSQEDQEDADSPSAIESATFTLPPTNVPLPEAPQEVALQQQVRDWVLTVDGVTQVLTLDIDVPGDESPLLYAELEIGSGYNNTSIPNQLVAKVSEMLGTSQYSDVVVIMNDGTLMTEYALDLESSGWNETILTSSPASTQSN